MTTLTGRPRTALLVIDVQNGVVGEAHERDRVVANIAVLVDKARAEHVPVVWVAHSDDSGMPRGSQAWQYVDELHRDESEPLVHKTFADSFEDTDLEAVLTELDVGPGQVISHTNMYGSGHRAPGRAAGTVDTADVDFSAKG